MTRKICVVVNSRANYGRLKHLMKAIDAHPNLELKVIAGASALLYRYGQVAKIMERDGFKPDSFIYYIVEGENLETQAKSAGLGIIEMATALQRIRPDVVIVMADRFENISVAVSASYLNIPVAHVQGGEISGNIDETVRHAITKLSHLHFPSTALSAERIKRMGEEEWRVHCTGCPAMDILASIDLSLDEDFFVRNQGTGYHCSPTDSYIVVVQHPVTTSFGEGREQILCTLNSLRERPEVKIVLWPNVDAGSDDVSKGIREFREDHRDEAFAYFIGFSPEDYARLISKAVCLVGNSSSFIREGSYLGVPAVVVGDRQEGREHGENVLFCDHDGDQIKEAVREQIEHGPFACENRFGTGEAGVEIANILSTVKLDLRKRMTY